MGRRRTRLELSAAQQAEAQRLLRSSKDPRELERLRLALRAATGHHTLEDLASKAGRRRSTIQNWLTKFYRGGLDGLLERDAAPGVVSPVATPKVQQQLQDGLKAGRWTSAAQVAAWLQETHGITRSRKSIYYWFEKCDLPAPSAKPPPHGPGSGKRRVVTRRADSAR